MLIQRFWSALLAGLVVLFVIVLGDPIAWRVVVFVACIICAGEFVSMLGLSWRHPLAWWAYLIVAEVQWAPHWRISLVMEIMVAVTLLFPVALRNRITLQHSAAALVGALYIGYGGQALGALRALPDGRVWLWLVLILVWVTDTAAYFGGKWLKGSKLWPDISPKKTVSGSICGLVGAAAAAVVVGFIAVPGFHAASCALFGAMVSAVSQLGDLVESAYKRSAGVKDSGRLLPGHGGMLDRVDGLLFAAPFALFLILSGASTWF
ncbi:phosphatidate cytidylyltransferase [Alicyclobacillus cycloheptanicus]|uniref:Phosphatidate cytidylyltransferase n=1 Tax=Alicyclobacillus cycloheptanicus TaxID=1457 RepID=A0ABT9XLD0_9BACL|nr:phosphatidate cytidylyltransferase [Alicyclobacillus cycloheptanicus]MDQ0190531.1 phosphatidate cytidylyltransferase [Alicyclobacillus cycloheptanicus]WDM01374.1 phosphatidate cytidylyltransferase [Alicyclobacillus cycloheptanicus]